MAAINRIVVEGRLTRDVEIKEVGDKKVASGGIAVDHSVKKDGKWIKNAFFFEFGSWIGSDYQLEFFKQCLKKGTMVIIDGTLKQDSWEKDGKKQSKVSIVANSIRQVVMFKMGSDNQKDENRSSNSGSDDFPEDISF